MCPDTIWKAVNAASLLNIAFLAILSVKSSPVQILSFWCFCKWWSRSDQMVDDDEYSGNKTQHCWSFGHCVLCYIYDDLLFCWSFGEDFTDRHLILFDDLSNPFFNLWAQLRSIFWQWALHCCNVWWTCARILFFVFLHSRQSLRNCRSEYHQANHVSKLFCFCSNGRLQLVFYFSVLA